MDRIHLNLNGVPEIQDSFGQSIRLTNNKTLVLLAVLALESSKALPREKIARMIWDTAKDAESARNSLRNALSELRRILPPDTICADRVSVRLLPGRVVVAEFEPTEAFMSGVDHSWVRERRTTPLLHGIGEGHPLVLAARYLIDSSPREAIDFFASTESQWETMPTKLTMNLLEMSLSRASKPSSTRRVVEAMLDFQRTVAGEAVRTLESMKTRYNHALKKGEYALLSRQNIAYSQAQLSAGRFTEARRLSTEGLQLAHASKSKCLIGNALLASSVVLYHLGDVRAAIWSNRQAIQHFDQLGEEVFYLSARAWSAGMLIRAGQTVEALAAIDEWKSKSPNPEYDRMLPWILLAEAQVNAKHGRLDEAIVAARQSRSNGLAHGGLSPYVSSLDLEGLLLTQRGDLEEGAQRFAESSGLRLYKGMTISPLEKSVRSPVCNLIRSSLGAQALLPTPTPRDVLNS